MRIMFHEQDMAVMGKSTWYWKLREETDGASLREDGMEAVPELWTEH